MSSLTVIVVVGAFLAAFLTIFAVNLVLVDIFEGDRRERLRKLDQELMDQQKLRARQQARSGDAKSDAMAEARSLSQKPRKRLLEVLEEITMQSGARTSIAKLVGNCAIAGGVAFAILFLASRNLFVAIGGGVCAGAIPLLYILGLRSKRQNQIREQLPDVFELMSRVLRAGQSVSQSMKAVSEEFKPPVGVEFGYCYEQQNLGLPMDVALTDLATRTGVLELKIFVMAVLVHRQSGGNLANLLDNISNVVRQRFKMQTEVKSLTAEGRMQALVLLAMPVAMWLGLFFIKRPYALALFEHTSLVIVTISCMLFGALWIRRIVNFDF